MALSSRSIFSTAQPIRWYQTDGESHASAKIPGYLDWPVDFDQGIRHVPHPIVQQRQRKRNRYTSFAPYWPRLPGELQTQIIDDVSADSIPRGQAYHFFAHSLKAPRFLTKPEKAWLFVHQTFSPGSNENTFVPESDESAGRTISVVPFASFIDYALVCRQWRDQIYDRFYGNNHFHFNVLSHFHKDNEVAVTTEKLGQGENRKLLHISLRAFPPCYQCTSVLALANCNHRRGEDRGSLAPLTSRTAPYLRDVTIIVSWAPYPLPQADWRRLETSLAEINNVLGLNRAASSADNEEEKDEEHDVNLKHLRLFVSPGRVPWWARSQPHPGLEVSGLHLSVEDTTDRLVPSLHRITDNEEPVGTQKAVEERIVEPLKRLIGSARHVTLGGRMSAGFMQELRGVVTGGGNPVRMAGEEKDENVEEEDENVEVEVEEEE